MRQIQLSFNVLDVRGEEPKEWSGYIDANNYQEILHDLISICFTESGVKDYTEFCEEMLTFDRSKRFGTTNWGSKKMSETSTNDNEDLRIIYSEPEDFIPEEVRRAHGLGEYNTEQGSEKPPYESREVKCPWCDHVFMWIKHTDRSLNCVEYTSKETGKIVGMAKCPSCNKEMLVEDHVLIGYDPKDERFVAHGIRGI